MRVLLYDQDTERNRRLHQHLEDDNIPVIAAYCLKDFLMKFEKPSLKILLIEQTRIEHYNLNVEELLDRLGLTFTVIVYNDTAVCFEFTTYYLQTYFYYPFTTDKDKELIKKVKASLEKYKRHKERALQNKSQKPAQASSVNEDKLKLIIAQLSEKQKKLMLKLAEKKEGINTEEIIQILDAEKAKNKQNYAQSNIHRLRNKLQQLTGGEYIITYKNHIYQLLHIQSEG